MSYSTRRLWWPDFVQHLAGLVDNRCKPTGHGFQHAVRDTVAAAVGLPAAVVARDWFGGAWLQSQSNAPRTASTPSIGSRSSEISDGSDSHPSAQLQEGKPRGRSPTVRLTRNSDWAAARMHSLLPEQQEGGRALARQPGPALDGRL